MYDREQFEKTFPVPEGVEWSEEKQRYWYKSMELQALIALQAYSDWFVGWQAARTTHPEGMALVPLDGFVIEKGSDEYKEVIVTGPDLGMQTFWPDDAAYGLIKAMLPAKDAS